MGRGPDDPRATRTEAATGSADRDDLAGGAVDELAEAAYAALVDEGEPVDVGLGGVAAADLGATPDRDLGEVAATVVLADLDPDVGRAFHDQLVGVAEPDSMRAFDREGGDLRVVAMAVVDAGDGDA